MKVKEVSKEMVVERTGDSFITVTLLQNNAIGLDIDDIKEGDIYGWVVTGVDKEKREINFGLKKVEKGD